MEVCFHCQRVSQELTLRLVGTIERKAADPPADVRSDNSPDVVSGISLPIPSEIVYEATNGMVPPAHVHFPPPQDAPSCVREVVISADNPVPKTPPMEPSPSYSVGTDLDSLDRDPFELSVSSRTHQTHLVTTRYNLLSGNTQAITAAAHQVGDYDPLLFDLVSVVGRDEITRPLPGSQPAETSAEFPPPNKRKRVAALDERNGVKRIRHSQRADPQGSTQVGIVRFRSAQKQLMTARISGGPFYGSPVYKSPSALREFISTRGSMSTAPLRID